MIRNKQDNLMLYRGNDCPISHFITIHQPTLGEICDYGEQDYFHMLHTLCSTGADLKWQLDDMGIDYTAISDFELFYNVLARGFTRKQTAILFGDTLDFSRMSIQFHTQLEENVLVQFTENGDCIQIDRFVYTSIVDILRRMHRIKRNEEQPGNEETRRILIEDAREAYLESQNNSAPYQSFLLPLISSMVNTAGFKRNETTVFDMKIYAFMDSVQRIGKMKNADLLLQSGYSGFGMDLSKIDKKQLNWLGELD